VNGVNLGASESHSSAAEVGQDAAVEEADEVDDADEADEADGADGADGAGAVESGEPKADGSVDDEWGG
jgi:hypothetical protein